MPRYYIEYEHTYTVGDNVVHPGEKPGDTHVLRSTFGMTARNERAARRHAFDGWIQKSDMSPPVLIGVTLAPPRIT